MAKESRGRRITQRSLTNALRVAAAVAATLLLSNTAPAQEAFEAIRCDTDIPKAIIGKVMPSGRVIVIEEKYRNIGLKGEGGSVISDTLFMSGWTICGTEYELLIDRNNVVRDAILHVHSERKPGFVGICEINGQRTTDTIVAVLDIPVPVEAPLRYAPNDSTLVPVIAAWRIDEKRARFIKLSVGHLRCPRNGIFTQDGGP